MHDKEDFAHAVTWTLKASEYFITVLLKEIECLLKILDRTSDCNPNEERGPISLPDVP